jgi:haloalkane dehalogenase
LPEIYEYPFTSHYFKIGNNRLHYLDEGEGPPAVLLHGNPTWSYYYRHLVKELATRHRVVVPDHMGCGLSDKPVDYRYRLRTHIENLGGLLDHLEIDSFEMVVHDWGGAIGMGYATSFPERIKKIVILNTAAFRSQRIPMRIRMCRWPGIGKLLVRGVNGFARAALFMAVENRLSREAERAYLMPYDSWANRIAIYEFVKDIPLHRSHPSYSTLLDIENKLGYLHDLEIPMLIVWGGRDFCFNDHFYKEWQQRFPAAMSHYLADAGHYVLEDGRGRVEQIISHFLDGST